MTAFWPASSVIFNARTSRAAAAPTTTLPTSGQRRSKESRTRKKKSTNSTQLVGKRTASGSRPRKSGRTDSYGDEEEESCGLAGWRRGGRGTGVADRLASWLAGWLAGWRAGWRAGCGLVTGRRRQRREPVVAANNPATRRVSKPAATPPRDSPRAAQHGARGWMITCRASVPQVHKKPDRKGNPRP